MPMIPVVLKPHQMHLTENDTNKEAEDEQDTGNGPIQPSVIECTARRRTAHKMKGRCKCMFGCLIDPASLGSSFSPSPSPSPIPTPSHTLPPYSCSVSHSISHPLSHYCSCSRSISIVLLMYNISFYQCLLYIIPCVNQ